MATLATLESPIVQTPREIVMSSNMNMKSYVGRALIAAVLIGLAVLGSLAGAKAFNLFPKAAPATAVTINGKSAGIESTVNYKWTDILGPNGTHIYTQCSSIETGQRVYLTSGGNQTFRTDSHCK